MLVFMALLVPQAYAAPSVLSVSLDGAAVVGHSATLRVRAVDASAPVSGMFVWLAPDSPYATSACRPPDSFGRRSLGPFTPGSPVTLAAPQSFDSPRPLVGLIRVDAGGCGVPAASVLHPLTVRPVRPGRKPREPTLGPPVPLPPPVDATPAANAAADAVSAAARRCPGSRSRLGASLSGRRAARKSALCLINRLRRRYGLRPLRENRRLSQAAAKHSRSMVRRGFFGHVQPGGIDLVDRLRRAHYLPARAWLVGENLAAGTARRSAPATHVRGWLRSAPHRANLLSRRFREIGLGVASGFPRVSRKRGGTYTANFGYRR
jgi:uncharacterized protein YkwD